MTRQSLFLISSPGEPCTRTSPERKLRVGRVGFSKRKMLILEPKWPETNGQVCITYTPPSTLNNTCSCDNHTLRLFYQTTTVRRVIGTIFHRFCLVARKLLCAKNVAPANVLYTSHEVKTARARASKKLEKQGVSASKIEPGSVRATENRARAARFARQNAKKSREAHRFFGKRARASRQGEQERSCKAAKSAQVTSSLDDGATRTLGMIIRYAVQKLALG